MKDWFASNWPYLVIVIVYVAERTTAISSDFADKLCVIVRAISTSDNLGSPTKEAMQLGPLNHDPDLDAALDEVHPENTPRVSKGRRFLRGLLKVIPLVTRFKP